MKERLRLFYIKHILQHLFVWQARHLPFFVDFAYIYLGELQKDMQKKLLQPDFIKQARSLLQELEEQKHKAEF